VQANPKPIKVSFKTFAVTNTLAYFA
jgi:hypothetical protein